MSDARKAAQGLSEGINCLAEITDSLKAGANAATACSGGKGGIGGSGGKGGGGLGGHSIGIAHVGDAPKVAGATITPGKAGEGGDGEGATGQGAGGEAGTVVSF